jgi:hypothetical protein
MNFVWFWTFWHWSKEGFRAGAMLRGPLLGIAGHWDEWFRHEASQADLDAIENTGRTERGQREFIVWLRRHWAREAGWGENRSVERFVLRQLGHVPPFSEWSALEAHRAGYGTGGIHAIVLTEGSPGESEDVRPVEAVALPLGADTAAPAVVAEGFVADEAELATPRRAAMSLLGGKGLMAFVALWIACGRRPYPHWMGIALGLGWLAVVGLIVFLLTGPEPGESLLPLCLALVALWSSLVATSLVIAGTQVLRAWRGGRDLRIRLEESQVRLRMDGGLTLKGGSAGLAFCLNILLAVYRASPRLVMRSWLWQRLFRKMRSHASSWAATGVVTSDSRVRPVVLEPKVRACLHETRIQHLLTPRQRGTGRRAMDRLSDSLEMVNPREALVAPLAGTPRLGLAAEKRRLRLRRCSHVARSLMAIGRLGSAWQVGLNALATVASMVLLVALPDLRSLLLPPPAPAVVAPSSPSPYHLWVSLDTKHPDRFLVVLESGFWSNRRSEVTLQTGASPSVRAEIRLQRVARQTTDDEEDGTVWIERRRWFLGREFTPGERVGRYSFSYVNRLGHE